MHIVCPSCTTAYAVNPATFGDAGRTVRCARCKEVWLARPQDLTRPRVKVPAMAEPEPDDDLSAWGVTADDGTADMPEVDSPSISADWPAEADRGHEDADWASMAQQDTPGAPQPAGRSRLGALLHRLPLPALPRIAVPKINLTGACLAMTALVMGLVIWRGDVVRLMPQTAAFYQAFGLTVNLRSLAFKDVKVTTETVDGKPVLVIEGMIVSETRSPVALPRLRFLVRDAAGTEIYAWNAVLEQPGLNPGDKAWFRSRLASPPADGRSLDVRFLNKRDVASGA